MPYSDTNNDLRQPLKIEITNLFPEDTYPPEWAEARDREITMIHQDISEQFRVNSRHNRS
jgi:hypothetical protein